MSDADDAIRNAVNVETKERHGEAAFVHSTIVVSLVEIARREDQGPGTPNTFVTVKSLHPVPMETALRVLEDAAAQIRWQAENG